jgi:hypothetical protein
MPTERRQKIVSEYLYAVRRAHNAEWKKALASATRG